MKKKYIVSLFCFFIFGLLLFVYNLTQQIGTFLLWIPQNIYSKVGVSEEKILNALNDLYLRPDYKFVYNFTINNNYQEYFLYFSVLFLLISIGSLFFPEKKIKD